MATSLLGIHPPYPGLAGSTRPVLPRCEAIRPSGGLFTSVRRQKLGPGWTDLVKSCFASSCFVTLDFWCLWASVSSWQRRMTAVIVIESLGRRVSMMNSCGTKCQQFRDSEVTGGGRAPFPSGPWRSVSHLVGLAPRCVQSA